MAWLALGDLGAAEMALGLERSLHKPIQPGNITTPVPDFTAMTDNVPADTWQGVGGVLLNVARPGIGDGHFTMTTGRSDTTSLGDEFYCAIRARYDKPADLPQVGRNLYFQTQMKGSPQNALSTTLGKTLDFVWRNPTTMHRDPLGLIPWGHEMVAVIGVKLAKSGGFVECWYGVDGVDVSGPPVHGHSNINSWQGDRAHNTIGGYRDPGKGGIYRLWIPGFGRAATPARALELAA